MPARGKRLWHHQAGSGGLAAAPPILLARALDGGFGFALIRIDRPSGCSMSKAPVLRTRSLSFR
jgi:hypothetical protein